jgi:hypothetical protein
MAGSDAKWRHKKTRVGKPSTPNAKAGGDATVEAAAKNRLPKVPRLSRNGDSLRQHKLNPRRLHQETIKAELRIAPKKTRVDPAQVPPDEPGLDFSPTVKGNLSLEEKIFILERKFVDNWGAKRIAATVKRDVTTIEKFITAYRSTKTLARLHLEAQAENLAKRIVRKADVDQGLEIMDRLDILKKQNRGNEAGNAQFNIIVGMPGQPTAVAAIPDQAAIEAAFTKENK